MHIPAVFAALAIFAEFFGTLGVTAGFLTRIAALGILVVMLVAVWTSHRHHGFFMNGETMLDFTPVRDYEVAMSAFAQAFTQEDCARWTEASIERFLELLDTADEEAVSRIPIDPDANDPYAADPQDQHLEWTLGHVIAHTTASADEYATVAAELARGIPFHGRPRSERSWYEMQTLTDCRQRLHESRRLRLASLQMWPDRPNLTEGYVPWEASGWVNATGIFTWGLAHDDDHYRQVQKILAQGHP